MPAQWQPRRRPATWTWAGRSQSPPPRTRSAAPTPRRSRRWTSWAGLCRAGARFVSERNAATTTQSAALATQGEEGREEERSRGLGGEGRLEVPWNAREKKDTVAPKPGGSSTFLLECLCNAVQPSGSRTWLHSRKEISKGRETTPKGQRKGKGWVKGREKKYRKAEKRQRKGSDRQRNRVGCRTAACRTRCRTAGSTASPCRRSFESATRGDQSHCVGGYSVFGAWTTTDSMMGSPAGAIHEVAMAGTAGPDQEAGHRVQDGRVRRPGVDDRRVDHGGHAHHLGHRRKFCQPLHFLLKTKHGQKRWWRALAAALASGV